jgi:hypothetical protein
MLSKEKKSNDIPYENHFIFPRLKVFRELRFLAGFSKLLFFLSSLMAIIGILLAYLSAAVLT